MLTREEIGRIESACLEGDLTRILAFSLSSAHRTLPVYQVYAEVDSGLRGFGLIHDGFVGAWRVLRARPGASRDALAPRLEVAIRDGESDLETINSAENPGLAEALTVESISAATLALRAFLEGSRSGAFDAALGALEVDSVWAEAEAELPSADGVVSWEGLRRQYEQQLRDLTLLAPGESDEQLVFRDLATRAEREGMPYLVRMRGLLSPS
jgi:hypothetical protein